MIRRPLDKPFELFLLVMCLISGVGTLLGGPRPNSIQSELNHAWIVVWALLLTGGGALGLAGLLWRGRSIITAITVEQVGLLAAGGGTAIYAVVVIATAGQRGYFAAGTSLAFSFACVARVVTTARYVRAKRNE